MTTKNAIESGLKKRVLLVDDEARVRASLKAVLEPNYEVIQAADAQEGLDLFHKEAPHVVLLDVILPGTDGLSVLQTLRTEQNTTPVIMLTGTKSVKTAVDAMKLGAADYLSKPFDVEELRVSQPDRKEPSDAGNLRQNRTGRRQSYYRVDYR